MLLSATGLADDGTLPPRILRCRWRAHPDAAPLQYDYASPPVLPVLPRGEVVMWVFARRQPRPVVALAELDRNASILRRHAVPQPALGVRFLAPEKAGVTWLGVIFRDGARETLFPFVCMTLRRAVRDIPNGQTLRVGDTVIGRYGDPSISRNRRVFDRRDDYAPPILFGEILPALETHLITPHLRLGHMVIPTEKTGARHMRLFPVQPHFLRNVERFFDALAAADLPVSAIRVLSLFRAPPYNRAVGSGAFSRHVYGDAIDLFFDADNDGRADDLTGDGKVNRADALAVVHAVEAAQHAGDLSMGGIGVYYFPYVTRKHRLTFHIDFRGHRATWGQVYDRRGRPRAFEWISRYFAEEDRRRQERYR